MAERPLAQALSALSKFLVTDTSMGDTLQRVAEIAEDAVPNACFVGLTMLDQHGKPATSVFTDPLSPEIDQAQYDSGRGPCLDAFRQKRTIRLDDVTAAREYPEFAAAAKAKGITSTLSLPMVAGDEGLGAMNLYSAQVNGFDADDEAMGTELATAASVVLANASSYWSAFDLSQQLTAAMASRAVIEQAKGILMARAPGIDADEAFDLLRKASQRENVKLREVAQRVVERRTPVT